ncbi:MAG: hypothetical protein EOO01_39810 [Chitinophagaceae bacterium]|nr:MAG: hypothetical protein EOO01_39810 [Chitinophagaceae bacterium]
MKYIPCFPRARLAYSLCLLMLYFSQIAIAQSPSDREEAKKTMEAYLDAFYFGDSLKIVNYFSPAVVKYGYYKPKDSADYKGFPMTYQHMLNYTRSVREGREITPVNAVKKVELFEVQNQTASGKVTAFWGTDYLLLAKEKGRWMIRMILWQGQE